MKGTSEPPATKLAGRSIRVRGTVQGVGFRPFVWKIANDENIVGFVSNDGDGVIISAWAAADKLDRMVDMLRNEHPPLAVVEAVEWVEIEWKDDVPSKFSIVESTAGSAKTQVSFDAATCVDCVEDVMNPFSRRYRYPFTNCTNCGPRLTIIRAIPYDRANTSMSVFPMCAECREEYENPADRRFHAQPNACSKCGPNVALQRADERAFSIESLTQLDELDAVATLLLRGEIIAMKGLGGFHLACDATSEVAVAKLRQRKHRWQKPLALMARDMDVIRKYCVVTEQDEILLKSAHAPIVLMAKLPGINIADDVAPNQTTLGFMLPYTPMHRLALRRVDRPIVLTSANLSEEPQCIENSDAKLRLSEIADWFLFHDRDIVNRLDDSVVRVVSGTPRLLRRARGYAPQPIPLPPGFDESPHILAMGAELKNTLCLVKERSAILTQHIGDLADARTNADYQHALELFQNLYQHNPLHIAVDFHPEYLSTKLGKKIAQERNLVLHEVQHHHAHIVACMAENSWSAQAGPVLGVALDGLGYGENELWGGEFLVADYKDFERVGTFKPVALIGGSQAMREPWRNTYAHILAEMGWAQFKMNFEELELTSFFESKPLATIDSMLKSGVNVPLASSCGRLFDAVAAAVGLCRDTASYEGQAAIELEACVDMVELLEKDDTLAYPFAIPRLGGNGLPYIEPIAVWQALLGDMILGTARGVMSARFHKGLAKVIVKMIDKVTRRDGERFITTVALSGGVFQNKILLEQVISRLEREQFKVLTHAHVPANDGGISLGQALVVAARVGSQGVS